METNNRNIKHSVLANSFLNWLLATLKQTNNAGNDGIVCKIFLKGVGTRFVWFPQIFRPANAD